MGSDTTWNCNTPCPILAYLLLHVSISFFLQDSCRSYLWTTKTMKWSLQFDVRNINSTVHAGTNQARWPACRRMSIKNPIGGLAHTHTTGAGVKPRSKLSQPTQYTVTIQSHFSCPMLTRHSGWWNLPHKCQLFAFVFSFNLSDCNFDAAWNVQLTKTKKKEKTAFGAHGWWLTASGNICAKLHTSNLQVFSHVCVHSALFNRDLINKPCVSFNDSRMN